MANSLMDQLLKAGVVDKKQANRAKQQKRDARQSGDATVNTTISDEVTRKREQKAARDRELNLLRQREQAEKALRAQAQQWIVEYRLTRDDGEITYHFQHDNRISSILVTESQRDALIKGRLGLAYFDGRYELLPQTIVNKLLERAPDYVLQSEQRALSAEEEQAYADFPVPDDLIW